MLEQLTPTITLPPIAGRSLECRVYERQACELNGFCQPASAGGFQETRWAATIRDISQGGVRLLLRRRYEPGAGLAIELPVGEDKSGCTFFAKVVHVKPLHDGFWSLGCQFVSPLSDEEIERLVGPVGGEKRAISGVHFELLNPDGALVDCIINCLEVSNTWPLAPAKTVRIRGGAEAGRPWSVRVKVVACSQQGARWNLRCQLLLRPAAADILRALSRSGSGD